MTQWCIYWLGIWSITRNINSVKCQLPSLACEYVGVIILKGNMEFYKQDFNVFAFKVYKNQFVKRHRYWPLAFTVMLLEITYGCLKQSQLNLSCLYTLYIDEFCFNNRCPLFPSNFFKVLLQFIHWKPFIR